MEAASTPRLLQDFTGARNGQPARVAFLLEILHHRVIQFFTEGAHQRLTVAQGLRQPFQGLTQGIGHGDRHIYRKRPVEDVLNYWWVCCMRQ
ncbi:MAG: hypothetical protein ACMX3H_03640 [Sodalis sp. (in: enterobacteria)]|uniref:hypothetical protein n=1 Tax=Sodalis sp. (in: enterobacteria) TaxID=1898979 RepID=UPI0039E3E80B